MGSIHCFFCGGKACKYESYENWVDVKNSHNAIEGLYSNWVTDEILATARPSTRIIKQYNIIKQFHAHNIGAIINLQQPGEHQNCGDGISSYSGFSYHPEDFMNENIFYYNFGWKDLKVPGFDLALNVVQVISYTLSQGKKVAIHCHAGLGRTGLIIACYLVFSKLFTASEAIKQVRMHRNMSIQTSRQAGFVWKFEEALKQLRIVYIHPSSSPIPLTTVLRRQRRYLHGNEGRLLRNVPKIVDRLCSKLCVLVGYGGICEARDLTLEETTRRPLVKESVNNDSWVLLEQEECGILLLDLLIEWLSLLKHPLFSPEAMEFVLTFSASSLPAPIISTSNFIQPPPLHIPDPSTTPTATPVPSISPKLPLQQTPLSSPLMDSIESTIAALSVSISEQIPQPCQYTHPPTESVVAQLSTKSVFVPTPLSTAFLPLLLEPTRSTLLCILNMTHTIHLPEYYFERLGSVLLPDTPASSAAQFLQQL